MGKTLKQRLNIWQSFFRGSDRHVVHQDPGYPPVDDALMGFLRAMYEEHGTPTQRSGNWIVVGDSKLMTRVARFSDRQASNRHQFQADFVTLLPSGEQIIESFAGIGSSVTEAMKDVCKSFQDSTFHALYAALLDSSCEHVDIDEWTIAGVPRKVTLGWLRTRGSFPVDQWEPVYERIRNQMEALELSPGLHWVRYFYAHIPGQQPTTELLLDNETEEVLQQQMATFPWPVTDAFYTARLFFTIQNA